MPDVVVYIEHVARCTVGHELSSVRLISPFVLRTAEPPISVLAGRRVVAVRRLGKRVALEFEDELFAVIHLMVAGRLHWLEPKATVGPWRTKSSPSSTATLSH